MKQWFTLLVFALLASPFLTNAQTADEIIEKHIKAMGGADKLKSIQSVVMEGEINAQNMKIPISMTTVHNKAWRMDFSMMGMNAFMIMRSDSGWMFMPFSGQTAPEAIPADQLKEGKSQLDIQGQLLDYKEKGHTVEYIGMDDVEGTECYKLKLTEKEGKVSYYLIDPASYYVVRRTGKQNIGGKEMEISTDLGDYKAVEGGYIFPHSIASQNGPIVMTKVSVNPKVDDSKFVPSMN